MKTYKTFDEWLVDFKERIAGVGVEKIAIANIAWEECEKNFQAELESLKQRLEAGATIIQIARWIKDDPSGDFQFKKDLIIALADYDQHNSKKETKPKDHSDGDYSYLCGNPYCRCTA